MVKNTQSQEPFRAHQEPVQLRRRDRACSEGIFECWTLIFLRALPGRPARPSWKSTAPISRLSCKEDHSPLTLADMRSHRLIADSLRSTAPLIWPCSQKRGKRSPSKSEGTGTGSGWLTRLTEQRKLLQTKWRIHSEYRPGGR